MNKKVKKISWMLILILLWLFIIIEIYTTYVDMYNFRQLDKVKFILKDLKRDDKQFFYLKDFNEIYNINLKPIKNCYYLRNYRSEDRISYTFWFKLESFIYKYIYWDNYYIYPKYDLPYTQWCESWIWCYDKTRKNFEYIISNPCN